MEYESKWRRFVAKGETLDLLFEYVLDMTIRKSWRYNDLPGSMNYGSLGHYGRSTKPIYAL